MGGHRKRNLVRQFVDSPRAGKANRHSPASEFRALRNVALLEMMFATGMRVGEISATNLEDFHAAESAIKVHGKGGKERMVYLVDPFTTEVQREYISQRRLLPITSRAL